MANGGTTISLLPVGSATPAVGVAGASAPILELHGGPVAATAISALGDARIIVGTDGLIYASENGGAYTALPTTNSPWTRTGTVVALSITGDTEVNPFDDGTTAFGKNNKRWSSVTTGSNGLSCFSVSGGAFARARYAGLDVAWGTGAIAPDVGLQRTGVKELSVTPGDGAGSGGLFPFSDNNATGLLGKKTSRWAEVVSMSHRVFNLTTDTQPTANLTNGYITFGPGTSTPDCGFFRVSPSLIAVTDGEIDSNASTLIPSYDNTASLGNAANRWTSLVLAPTGVRVLAAASDTNTTTTVGSASITMGAGGAAAVDVGIIRSAAGVFEITDAGAGSGSVNPHADNSGTMGTAAKRWASQNTGPTGVLVYNATNDANPIAALRVSGGNAEVSLGAGGASAPDARIIRSGANTMAMATAGGQGATVNPGADNSGSMGTAAVRWDSANASGSAAGKGFFIWTGSGDANASAHLGGSSIELGAGGATALDTRIQRTAATTLRIDDGASGAVNVYPGADNVGQIGDPNNRWALVRATTITSGDMCFDDQTCQVCGQPFEEGDDLVLRVIRIEPDGDTGRRLTRTVPAHHGCK